MDKDRSKCAMILFGFEQDMGDFIRRFASDPMLLPQGISKKIASRSGRTSLTVDEFIELSYVEELISSVDAISADATGVPQEYKSKLKTLVEALDIYTIRNSVSHPNRPFITCYWYRLAAIASDPVLDFLEFRRTQQAFGAAEQGTLEPVPQEWLDSLVWSIPNNLPPSFEHSITGLIGRQKEERALEGVLSNPRNPLIAIVGPGGVGKTALSLSVLSRMIRMPQVAEVVDGVLFASMKLERLTANGIEKIDGIATFEALEEGLVAAAEDVFDIDADTFQEAQDQLFSKRVLLCIDNAETLLRDRADEFDAWNQKLPPNWRVLVTSRVTVNSANCLPVGDLLEPQAETLAKVYAARKGINTIPVENIPDLVKACMCNPLAIRLTIDLYQRGKQLPEAIGISKQNIASFSYNNLIETISELSVEVLEALFLAGELDRLAISDLISRNVDDTAQAVGDLLRTSLLGRRQTDHTEVYFVNDSVRELLTVSPRNLMAREIILAKIRQNRNLSFQIVSEQTEHGVSEYDWNYIPVDIPQGLKAILHRASKKLIRKKPDRAHLAALYDALKAAQGTYGTNGIFCIFFAKVLVGLRSIDDAEKMFRKAVELCRESVSYRIELGKFFHSERRFEDAAHIYRALREDGYFDPEKTNQNIAGAIVSGYCLSHLFSGGYNTVLDLTKTWKNDPNHKGILGVFRAGALKRQSENTALSLPERMEILRRACSILDDIFTNLGFVASGISVCKNIIDEIAYYAAISLANVPVGTVTQILDFCEKYAVSIYSEHKDGISSLPRIVEALIAVDIPENPFHSVRWAEFLRREECPVREFPDDAILVKIVNVPRVQAGHPKYLIGENRDGQRYFLHFQNVRDGGWADWCRLDIDSEVGIYAAPRPVEEDKLPSAPAIFLGACSFS